MRINYPRFLFSLVFGLFPIYGAIELGWKFHDMLALYWFESLVFIGDALLKFWSTHRHYLTADADKKDEFLKLSFAEAFQKKIKLTVIIALIIGFFGVLHAAVLWNVFISDSNLNAGDPTYGAQKLFEYVINSDLMMAIAVSAGMRLVLFVTDFLIKGKHKTSEAAGAMAVCFMRLTILHISLIALGFIFDMFNADAIYLVIAFVGFKAVADAGAGELDFEKLGKKEQPSE